MTIPCCVRNRSRLTATVRSRRSGSGVPSRLLQTTSASLPLRTTLGVSTSRARWGVRRRRHGGGLDASRTTGWRRAAASRWATAGWTATASPSAAGARRRCPASTRFTGRRRLHDGSAVDRLRARNAHRVANSSAAPLAPVRHRESGHRIGLRSDDAMLPASRVPLPASRNAPLTHRHDRPRLGLHAGAQADEGRLADRALAPVDHRAEPGRARQL